MTMKRETTFLRFIAPFLSSVSITDGMSYRLLMTTICQASCIHTYMSFSVLEKIISPESHNWYWERLRFQRGSV